VCVGTLGIIGSENEVEVEDLAMSDLVLETREEGLLLPNLALEVGEDWVLETLAYDWLLENLVFGVGKDLVFIVLVDDWLLRDSVLSVAGEALLTFLLGEGLGLNESSPKDLVRRFLLRDDGVLDAA